ncbi:hypothetical protein ACFWMR_18010 [Amycolatopsis thailandensis]|uniref:hypothetical protein n=1 Tax=Amycolatopsis thailandensis TaxID=589330 RepID=UPI00366827C6
MKKFVRAENFRVPKRILPLVAVVSAAAFLSAGAAESAIGAPTDDLPPAIVEDYSYPDAAKILAERGIKLIKGDGHILFADCAAGTGQAEVWSRTKGHLCFKISGATGLLTMEVPEAYLITGAGAHTIVADIVVDGVPSTVTVAKGEFRGIGEGSDPNSGPATLLEFHSAAA